MNTHVTLKGKIVVTCSQRIYVGYWRGSSTAFLSVVVVGALGMGGGVPFRSKRT